MDNFTINKKKTLSLAVSMLPGLIFSIITTDDYYLLASFLSVCAIIPYGEAHSSKITSVSYALMIALEVPIVYFLLDHWVMFLLFMVIHCFIFAVLERENKHLKSMTSWWVIGVTYSGFKLATPSIGFVLPQYYYVVICSLIGVITGLMFSSSQHFSLPAFKIKKEYLNYYIKYPIGFISTITLWHYFNIPEGEWFIWSCFSVLSLDFKKASQKYKHRLIGVFIGIACGMIVANLIPYSEYLHYIYLACILLTLRLFKNYLYSFMTRCFFIMLYASSNFLSIGVYRIMDIMLGGAIGMAVSYVLRNKEQRNV